MPLGLKNSQQSSSSPGDMSLLQDTETTRERLAMEGTRCRRGWEAMGPGHKARRDQAEGQVGSWFMSTGALPWLQAQGFSSEKTASANSREDPHKAEGKKTRGMGCFFFFKMQE